jgi:CubicO group peptidase (beta-lactamase class C family)
MHRVILRTLALALVAARAGGAQAVSAPPADLDAWVGRVMQTFKVPGLSIAVVKDGKVVMARGYGVRRLGDPTPVDARTLFGIASNTKAFTATALGLLVEEGKLEWDAPVIRYLPAFAMYDPFVTRELTVRDLLVHRSGLGLGAGDLLWWPTSTYDRKEIVRRLRYIKPATSFRSAYAYDNVLYSVAGELVEALSGMTWEDFVTRRILAKVGMTGSAVRHSDGGRGANAASPHADVEGAMRPVAPFASDNVNPAGGINSSAEDMAKWAITQLDSGRLADGTRLFSPALTRQLWRVVTPVPFGDPPPALANLRANFNGYALGFGIRDYRGRKLIQHTGGLPGFVSKVVMVPDLKLGIVVLTNAESGATFEAITWRLIDHFMGVASPDYLTIYRQLADQGAAGVTADTVNALARRDATSRPSLPLASYAGTYIDAWYGDVTIALEGDHLVMRFGHTPALSGPLQHFQHDTFIARWSDREQRADAYVTFALNPDGTIDRVRMAKFSPDVDFSFDFQDLLLTPVKRSAP